MRYEPSPEEIQRDKLYRNMGLADAEYARIVEKLGRLPNYTETGLFSVLWSEHCSYKNSKPVLKKFPTEGERVLQGPGEGAGVVDIGQGKAVVFKIESHNHPSAVEPYHGAATGIGGILRDVFSMGARPIAVLNSLRFGSWRMNAPMPAGSCGGHGRLRQCGGNAHRGRESVWPATPATW